MNVFFWDSLVFFVLKLNKNKTLRRHQPNVVNKQCVVYYFKCGLCGMYHIGYTGIKSFSFFCWTLCIVGQKVRTKSWMTAISLSPLREYCYYLVWSSNIRVKGDKMKRENNPIRLPLETWWSLSVPQCAASNKGKWNSWCWYTTRHLHQRIEAHKSLSSSVGQHMKMKHDLDKPELKAHFTILKKCKSKFDCLVHKMLLIRERQPSLNKQSDSICAKVFVWPLPFVF